MIARDELRLLSYYAASELAGSVLLGRLALQTASARIRVPLTEQAAEEARHAWILTETIVSLGASPLRVRDTYQAQVGRIYGLPRDIVDVLCLTRVLEDGVLEHYRMHERIAGLDPAIRRALRRIIRDETGHVGWIDIELDRFAKRHGRAAVDRSLERAESASRAVFTKLRRSALARRYFGNALADRDGR